MADLAELANKKYEELKGKREKLSKDLAEVDKELKPLEAYLKAIGAIVEPEKPRRGRKPKEKKTA